jgi:hypothetical protein
VLGLVSLGPPFVGSYEDFPAHHAMIASPLVANVLILDAFVYWKVMDAQVSGLETSELAPAPLRFNDLA